MFSQSGGQRAGLVAIPGRAMTAGKKQQVAAEAADAAAVAAYSCRQEANRVLGTAPPTPPAAPEPQLREVQPIVAAEVHAAVSPKNTGQEAALKLQRGGGNKVGMPARKASPARARLSAKHVTEHDSAQQQQKQQPEQQEQEQEQQQRRWLR